MPISRTVYQKERIVPVTFERSRDISTTHQTPDPDDRGFTNEHGPIVGVCRGDTAQIGVLRKLLDADAPLWATSNDTRRVEIPEGSQQLPNGDRVDLVFNAGNSDGSAEILIHAQAVDGPIIARLIVQISRILNVRCAVHRTAIFGPSGVRSASNTTTTSDSDIDSIFAEANKIWRPC